VRARRAEGQSKQEGARFLAVPAIQALILIKGRIPFSDIGGVSPRCIDRLAQNRLGAARTKAKPKPSPSENVKRALAATRIEGMLGETAGLPFATRLRSDRLRLAVVDGQGNPTESRGCA
jgi:hypothetical protein